jgi:hypothetical protein
MQTLNETAIQHIFIPPIALPAAPVHYAVQ